MNIFNIKPSKEKIQDYETPVLKDWLNYKSSDIQLAMNQIQNKLEDGIRPAHQKTLFGAKAF